jgi:chromosome partitioning protein
VNRAADTYLVTQPREGLDVPIVTMLNQKGGVGKTSTCYHLAGTLGLAGQRVLLVDADPQSSLTQGFWGPQAARQLDPAATVAAILAGDEPFPEQVIRPTDYPGIDLVPGSRVASDHNVPRPHDCDWPTQTSLRDFLEPVRGRYDLVVIDVPPNLHLCSWAALVASDALVVPLQPEDFGAQGIADVRESVARVQAGPNPGLRLLGYLITMLSPRRAVHQAYVARLRGLYGSAVFDTAVPESVDFVEAIAQRKPVAQYKPRGAAAKVIKALAAELAGRLAETDSRGSVGDQEAA